MRMQCSARECTRRACAGEAVLHQVDGLRLRQRRGGGARREEERRLRLQLVVQDGHDQRLPAALAAVPRALVAANRVVRVHTPLACATQGADRGLQAPRTRQNRARTRMAQWNTSRAFGVEAGADVEGVVREEALVVQRVAQQLRDGAEVWQHRAVSAGTARRKRRAASQKRTCAMAGHDIGAPWLCWYMTWRACRCFCSVTASARKPGEPITQRSELRAWRGSVRQAGESYAQQP